MALDKVIFIRIDVEDYSNKGWVFDNEGNFLSILVCKGWDTLDEEIRRNYSLTHDDSWCYCSKPNDKCEIIMDDFGNELIALIIIVIPAIAIPLAAKEPINEAYAEIPFVGFCIAILALISYKKLLKWIINPKGRQYNNLKNSSIKKIEKQLKVFEKFKDTSMQY